MKIGITDPVELFWFDFAGGYWEHMEQNLQVVVTFLGG